jgi:uncharacterized protein YjcR
MTSETIKKSSAHYPDEVKTAAKMMYIRRTPVREIKTALGMNSERVIYQWAEKGHWDEMLQHETVEEAACRQLIRLIEKPVKDDADYKAITELTTLLDRLSGIDMRKAKALQIQGRAAAGEPTSSTSSGKTKKSKKNDIGSITAERLTEIREKLFFDYQKNWFDHLAERCRFILKSRQIGATFYFAWEAFENAVNTGENQIFLSASRNQANIFKAYIIKFAAEYFDVELKGTECIELTKDGKPWAELRFLSTNSTTAQGYHGHLYIDEVFWIPDFIKLDKLAGPMASHAKWRKTYFSTPSVKTHGAYPLWSGEKYNSRRSNKVEFDLSHKTARGGHKGADKIWRDIVTVEDAEKAGCNLFNIDELRDEYSEAEYNNLFMCHFMEAGLSVFNLSKLLACAVDSNVVWVDFKTGERRPIGNWPVWIGYDPARKGDKSSVIVLAIPQPDYPKFRVVEKLQLRGTYEAQAEEIRKLTEKYNVQFIGIDATGPGVGVYEKVKSFFWQTEAIVYNLDSKTRLVQKGLDVIENDRIEWDAEQVEIPQALLQIQQTTTGNDHITYVSNRKEETGHADVAWSLLHALSNEPLVKRKKVRMG